MGTGKKILLIDYDVESLKNWSEILRRNGYNIISAGSAEEAFKQVDREEGIDLILTDVYFVCGIDGVETVEGILKKRNIPVMFLSDHTGPEFVQRADRIDHCGYVIKSNGEAVAVASIKMAFRLNDATNSINTQKEEIEAANEEMQASMEELEAINLELVETQRDLIESEMKYRGLYESIRDAVVLVDMEGRIIDSNPAYQEMVDYTAEELKKFSYLDLSNDRWNVKEEEILKKQLFRRGYTDLYEKELVRRDGTLVPVEIRRFLIKNDSGKYTAALGIIRNITERKKAEREISEREQKFRAIFENTPYPVVINRLSDGVYIDANIKFQEHTGLKRADILGKTAGDIFKMQDPSDAGRMMEEFNSTGRIENFSFGILQESGTISHNLLSAYPLEINGEKCIVSITSDITDLVNAEQALRKSEYELTSLLNALLVGVGMIVDRKFFKVNSYLCNLLGYQEKELVGASTGIIYVDDAEFERVGKELYSMMFRLGQGISKATIRHKDGHILNGLISLTPIDPENLSAGACATLNDITALTRAEQALLESEERFRTMIQSSTDMIFSVSKTGLIMYESPSASKILGYEPDHFIGKSPFEHIHPEDRELTINDMNEVYQNANDGHPTVFRMKRADGKWVYIEAVGNNLIDIPSVNGIVITARDITDRISSEMALRESELRFKAIMEQSTLPMLIVDRQGTMVDANQAWAYLWNADRNKGIGKYNIFEDTQNLLLKPLFENALAGEPSDFPEHLYNPALIGRPGDMVWLKGRAYPLKDTAGYVTDVVVIMEDITKRKEAEEALRLSEEKFRNIFNNMTIGYFRTGMDGRIIDLNPACLSIFGFSSEDEARMMLNNTTEGVYVSKSDWLMVRDKILSGGHNFTGIIQLKKKDGNEFSGSLNMRIAKSAEGTMLYIEGLVEDVTSQLKTQEMLIQSEKMITVAGLAAGMAHEINNPLGIIMQNAENAVHRLIDDLPGNINAAAAAGTTLDNIREYIRSRRVDQYLTSIRDAGERAARIVGNMLQFSRGTESRIAYLSINNLLDRALDLASNDFDLRRKYDFRNIRIKKDYDSLPEIQCAETPIEQVFLNLFKNSAQAMSGGGSVSGETPEISIKTVNLGNSIRIEIGDNGPGMEESIRKRIFEPFFSTKEPGLGTGLGLSVSYYIIVDGHGGTISVESSPGSGTLFIITLPVKREV